MEKNVDFIVSTNDKDILIYHEDPVNEEKQQDVLKTYADAIAKANNGEN